VVRGLSFFILIHFLGNLSWKFVEFFSCKKWVLLNLTQLKIVVLKRAVNEFPIIIGHSFCFLKKFQYCTTKHIFSLNFFFDLSVTRRPLLHKKVFLRAKFWLFLADFRPIMFTNLPYRAC
jgi:hypothetical protein